MTCLKYAILSILHYGDVKHHPERVSSYRKWEEELNFSQVDIKNINISKLDQGDNCLYSLPLISVNKWEFHNKIITVWRDHYANIFSKGVASYSSSLIDCNNGKTHLLY